MVKVASTLFFSALVAAPAFAAVINVQGLHSRELTDQAIFGRELTTAEATEYVREVEDLYTRMPEEEAAVFIRGLETGLEARSPKSFFSKLWGGIKKVGKVAMKFIRREDDNVVARELDEEAEEVAREFEMDAREFEDEETFAREFEDEVYERDIEVDENLLERELGEELD